MRSRIDALVTEKSLNFLAVSRNADLVDIAASQDAENELGLKNVCAKLHPDQANEIDAVCGLLGITKRRFIESALLDAVALAHSIMDSEGVTEALDREGQV